MARPVALEVSSLLDQRPTGVGTYGRGLVRGLLAAVERRETSAEARQRFRLIYPVGRWRRRGAIRGLPLDSRPYLSGRRLSRWTSLVHLLDTRCPRSYRGPLVATVFDTISALPLSEELSLASERFRRKKVAAYRDVTARADVVVTLASAIRDEIVARFPAAKRVEVSPPGGDVPDERLYSRAPDLLREYGIAAPFLLAVGALCPRKNLEAVVAAFEAVRRRRPGLRLVLAGAPDYGWEGSEGERAVAASSGGILLPGYLPRDVLWAAFIEASCVLQLSHYEGFGLTVLEALAAGTPVVASRRGGLPEAGGGAAWLVEPDEPDEISDTVDRVLAGGPEIERRREEGRSFACSLTWERAGRTVLEIYEEVTGSRPK